MLIQRNSRRFKIGDLVADQNPTVNYKVADWFDNIIDVWNLRQIFALIQTADEETLAI